MSSILLFFEVIKPANQPGWQKSISSHLSQYCSTDEIEVIEESRTTAQINVRYELKKISIDEFELLIKKSGAAIKKVNVHLPTELSGTANPYGASAIALSMKEELGKIDGILGGNIASNGEIRIEIDAAIDNKESKLEEAIKTITLIRSGGK